MRLLLILSIGLIVLQCSAQSIDESDDESLQCCPEEALQCCPEEVLQCCPEEVLQCCPEEVLEENALQCCPEDENALCGGRKSRSRRGCAERCPMRRRRGCNWVLVEGTDRVADTPADQTITPEEKQTETLQCCGEETALHGGRKSRKCHIRGCERGCPIRRRGGCGYWVLVEGTDRVADTPADQTITPEEKQTALVLLADEDEDSSDQVANPLHWWGQCDRYGCYGLPKYPVYYPRRRYYRRRYRGPRRYRYHRGYGWLEADDDDEVEQTMADPDEDIPSEEEQATPLYYTTRRVCTGTGWGRRCYNRRVWVR
ncbi:hypothetical protein PAPYR_6065 [Paratrimastix pyriformis]|uniref:Uncharacterized protein n=1 Tax=Paratrimastix pyriformis TaxID=342808 RepID=A0ABQ8UG65_9EUKA|nr:hypothetical protein PAPYR_6065 [Paratrimastix pyriformis]